MGLDLTGYRNIKKIDNPPLDEDGYLSDEVHEQDMIQIRINPNYPERALSLEDKACYSYEDCYGNFGCAYSTYSAIRNRLAQAAGYKKTKLLKKVTFENQNEFKYRSILSYPYEYGAWEAKKGLCWELINFSDCEGVIDCSICQKIYNDLCIIEEKFKTGLDSYDWHLKLFDNLKEVFHFGSQNGMVIFH